MAKFQFNHVQCNQKEEEEEFCSHNKIRKWLKDADYKYFHELFDGLKDKICYLQSLKEDRIYTYLDFETQLFFCTMCYLEKKASHGIEFDVAENLHILSVDDRDTWDNKFNPNCSGCYRTLFDSQRAENCFFCRMEFAAHNHFFKKYDFIPVCEDWYEKEENINENEEEANQEIYEHNEIQDQQDEGIHSD